MRLGQLVLNAASRLGIPCLRDNQHSRLEPMEEAYASDSRKESTVRALDDVEAEVPRKECIACGGAGCSICKMTEGDFAKQLVGIPADQEVMLSTFFPARDDVVDTLCACPELTAVLRGPSDLFVDLGCGDGRVVIEVAFKLGCAGLGVEIDEELIKAANKAATQRFDKNTTGRAKVCFVRKDFRHLDLSLAKVIYVFHPAHVCEFILREILPNTGLRDGTLVIVNGKEDWTPSVERASAEAGVGPKCRRLAKHIAGHGSFSALHFFEWQYTAPPS